MRLQLIDQNVGTDNGFVVAVGSVVVGVTKIEQKHIRESFWKKYYNDLSYET